MGSFIIEGGHKLKGEIQPQGAKNEALQILCAVLLTPEKVIINNVPDIVDINILIELLKDLGVKQAPFYVLIGAEMPAILIEVGFISNREEAKKLKNDKFLKSVATRTTQGIEAYIHSNTAHLLFRQED